MDREKLEPRNSSIPCASQDNNGTKSHISDDRDVIVIKIPKWKFFGFSVFFAGVLAVIVGVYLTSFGSRMDQETLDRLLKYVGQEGLSLFEEYDRDGDGYLSIHEFEPLIFRLIEVNVSSSSFEVFIEPWDEVLEIQAHFQPLLLKTMTKDMTYGSSEQLKGLKSWTRPAVSEMTFGASHFRSFLPPDSALVQLGAVYDVISYSASWFEMSTLSSNRYHPPKVISKSIIVHQLLSLFHPRPFVISRFGPQGTVACIRAYNDEMLDIVFRIHAEFQLNEPPLHPFWFTPAQFTGHLIINKNVSHVEYFHLYVPAAKVLNVDMEWLNGPKESENMEVDIGYMPQMELTITASSQPIPEDNGDSKTFAIADDLGLRERIAKIKWTEEISEEEALQALEVGMYPFKKIPYYNFTTVFDKAKEENKLIHSILLWGALDDQSC